jgi:superfamily I DNA and/or RNA helicase
MNLYQINSGVGESTITNLDFDIREYTDFIRNSIELLKRETFRIDILPKTENEKTKYSLKETTDKKQQKINDLLFDEKTEVVFDQNKNFNRSDEIKIKEKSEEGNYIILEGEPKGNILYLKPNTYQLDQQLKALNELRYRPLREHKPLLNLFGKPDDRCWNNNHNSFDEIEDWFILNDETRDGVTEQRQFTEKALNSPDFSLLEGPPGSGKTTTIIELVIQFALQGKRVLLCSATHAAIDNVIERIMGRYKEICEEFIVPVRISYSETPIKESVRPYILRNLVQTYKTEIQKHLKENQMLESQQYLYKNIQEKDRFIDRIILDSANLVAGTMVGILQHPDIRNNKLGAQFDVLIVDESSKVTFQEFLIPALHAKRWILVGDVKQLSPYTEDDYVAENLRQLIPKELQEALTKQFELKRLVADKRHDNSVKVYFSEKDTKVEFDAIKQEYPKLAVEQIDNQFSATSNEIAKLNGADILVCWNSRKVKEALSKYLFTPSVFVNGELENEVTAINRQNYFHKDKRNIDKIYRYEFSSKEENWAELLSSKLNQSFGFRNAGEEFANIDKEVEFLVPRKIKGDIQKIKRIAYPSILELLQNGIGKSENQKSNRVLSDGFSLWAKETRFESLTFQHRMQPDIAKTSAENFYTEHNNLLPANTVLEDRGWKYALNEPVVKWVHNSDQKFREGKILNPTEVKDMETELRKFIEWASKNPKMKDGKIEKYEVAVLGFYLEQDRELRKMVRRVTSKHRAFSQFHTDFVDIFLYTVDKFQGQEADMVLLGFTKFTKDAHYNSPNRLNVALTRARFKLILFGNMEWFKRNAKLKALRELATNFKSTLKY